MSKSIPGPKAKAILKRGVSLFQNGLIYVIGGERGIRTLDGLLTHTPLAGERFRPLSQLSEV